MARLHRTAPKMMSGLRGKRSPSQPVSGAGKHVDEKHGRGERAHLLVGGVELMLDEGKLAGQDVAVDVVEQVEN